MSSSIRNKQIEELLEQLAREFGISKEQAEEIYSLRFKFVRECISSNSLESILETKTVKKIGWIGMGTFYPNGKRIRQYINRKSKDNGTE